MDDYSSSKRLWTLSQENFPPIFSPATFMFLVAFRRIYLFVTNKNCKQRNRSPKTRCAATMLCAWFVPACASVRPFKSSATYIHLFSSSTTQLSFWNFEALRKEYSKKIIWNYSERVRERCIVYIYAIFVDVAFLYAARSFGTKICVVWYQSRKIYLMRARELREGKINVKYI